MQELRELALFATKVEHVAECALGGGDGGGEGGEAARRTALERQLTLFAAPTPRTKAPRSSRPARRARPPRAILRVATPTSEARALPRAVRAAAAAVRDGRRAAPRALAAAGMLIAM